MATSGSLNLSLPSGHRARLSWKLTGQNGMYSYIDYTIKWTSEPSNWTAGNIYVDVNGEYTQSYRYYKNAAGGSSGTDIGSGSLAVLRDTATNIGTFYLSISAEGTYQDSNYDNIDYTDYDSNTWEVYTSTKYGSGAQITAVSDFTDEISPVITYSYDRGSSVSAASLFAGVSFNGSEMNLPYREITDITGSYTFNFTEDDLNTLYTLLHNGENASVRFYIRTTEVVNGEIMHIENYLTKTFKFVNYTPVITPTLYDTNPATIALTGNANNLIRYMSDVHYKMDVELRKGALDVIGCYIQNGGVIEEGFLEGDFDNPTSNVFYFSATDDRGYTGTASKSYDVFWGDFINYIKLTSSLKCTPISGEGDLGINISGKYFNAHFGAAQNQMSLEYAVYKKGTTPQWINAGVIEPEMTDNTTYSYSWNVNNLDYTAQYVVAVKVTDLLMNAEAEISVVAKPVFYWNGEKFVFNVPVIINGDDVPAIASQGTSDIWTYRKWTDGTAECWGKKDFAVTFGTTTWGGMYTSGAIPGSNIMFPYELFIETPTIQASLLTRSIGGILMAPGGASSNIASKSQTGVYEICRGNATNGDFTICYSAKGRWK